MSCFCWGCRWTMQSNCSCFNLSLSCTHLTILYESVRQVLFHTIQVKHFTCSITHLPKTDNSKTQLNFVSFYVELERYWMEMCIPQSEDPLVWCYGKSKHFPKPCHLTNPYFCLPATSVAIDFFSAAGIIVNRLRSCLSSATWLHSPGENAIVKVPHIAAAFETQFGSNYTVNKQFQMAFVINATLL